MHPEKLKLIQMWMTKASRDLIMADRAMSAPPTLPDYAAFHCQQAAEKARKGFLAWQDQPLKRTHDLPELIADCVGINADFLDLKLAAQRLNPYSTRISYPDDPDPSADEAIEFIHLAWQITEFVSQRLPPEVHDAVIR
ncbi:HEPN domain-containing protein [soil metagenome]